MSDWTNTRALRLGAAAAILTLFGVAVVVLGVLGSDDARDSSGEVGAGAGPGSAPGASGVPGATDAAPPPDRFPDTNARPDHPLPLPPPNTPALVGRVLELGTSRPIAAATLTARDLAGTLLGSARSRRDGVYALSLAQGGEVRVTVVAPPYLPSTVTTVVPKDRARRLEIRLDAGLILRGRVTGDGKPLAGRRLTARLIGSGAGAGAGAVPGAPQVVRTNARGAYRMVGLTLGRYAVAVAAGQGFLGRETSVTLSGPVTEHEIELAAGGGLLVEVAGPETLGSADAVRLTALWDARQATELPAGITPPEGPLLPDEAAWPAYRFETLVPGAYLVSFSHPDWRRVTGQVEVIAGTTARLTLTLDRGRRIAGLVTNIQGQPLAGATITAYRNDPAEADARIATTTTDGRFALAGLDASVYQLRAQLHDHLGASGVADLRAADALGVRLALDPGLTLSGVVQDPSGAAIAGARITVHVGVGAGAPPAGASPVRFSDRAGRFALGGLRAGRVRVTVQAAQSQPYAQAVTLPSGELTIVLEPGWELAGRVTDARNRLVAGASVTLIATQRQAGAPAVTRSATTDAQGDYRITGCPAGNYRVLVRASEAPTLIETLALIDRQTVRDFQLARGFRLGGTVRREGGGPLPPARVSLTPMVVPGGDGSAQAQRSAPVDPRTGEFVIAGLARGRYELQVLDIRGQTPLGVQTTDVYQDVIDLEVLVRIGQRTTLAGTLLDAAKKPMPRVYLTLLAAPQPAGQRARYTAVTDAAGAFVFAGVLDGTYTLSARLRDGRTVEPVWPLTLKGERRDLVLTAARVLQGPRVRAVAARSEAARAGLKPGDVIRRYAGERVRSATELYRAITRNRQSGDRLVIEYTRDGITHTAAVAPGNLGVTVR